MLGARRLFSFWLIPSPWQPCAARTYVRTIHNRKCFFLLRSPLCACRLTPRTGLEQFFRFYILLCVCPHVRILWTCLKYIERKLLRRWTTRKWKVGWHTDSTKNYKKERREGCTYKMYNNISTGPKYIKSDPLSLSGKNLPLLCCCCCCQGADDQ